MPPATIFARVQPKSIKISEKYFYEADAINQFMRTKQENNQPKDAEGSLEITVPYDGEKHVTRQTLDDIQRQSAAVWHESDATVRIGYLSFASYGRADLEGKANFPLEHDSLPVDLPIKGPDLPLITDKGQAEELLHDRYRWQLKQTYTPKPPPSPPVKLTIQSYDEAQADESHRRLTNFLDKSERAKRDPKSKAPTAAEQQWIVEALTQQENLQQELTFDFHITLQLANNLAKEDKSNLPKLDRIAIRWPVAVAADQVVLELGEKKPGGPEESSPQVFYVHAKEGPGTLEWRNVGLQLPKDKDLPEKGPYTYTFPNMRLRVKQPGELYQVSTLQGTLEVKLPKFALSGLQVQFFDVRGQKSEPQPETQSQITVDFTIGLKDYAAGKALTLYQQFQFEGIRLDRSRAADIQALFAELGLTTRVAELNDLPGAHYYLIQGEKAQGLGSLTLWILGEGLPAYTHRTTVLPNGQTYNTGIRLGHTKLYLRGHTVGDTTSLLAIMNCVQQRLNALFHYVKAID